MKCYRVWFTDGYAMLVTAGNESEAKQEGERLSALRGFDGKVERVKCLDP